MLCGVTGRESGAGKTIHVVVTDEVPFEPKSE